MVHIEGESEKVLLYFYTLKPFSLSPSIYSSVYSGVDCFLATLFTAISSDYCCHFYSVDIEILMLIVYIVLSTYILHHI